MYFLQSKEHKITDTKKSKPIAHFKSLKGGGALCAGNAVALLVFGPVMP